ncbi:MAG: GNAT family N-acetyltransferase [Methyloceanibacter sp.]|jgi:ribosomal-protein-alanine N-acetyltransferase
MRGLASARAPVYLAVVSIRTERLLLRAPVSADAARISLLAGDYEVASMTGTIPHPYSAEMAADWINSHHDGEEGVAYAIDLGGDLIGCVGYRAYNSTHAEMGYWLGKPYWGMGYATEAARALILHAFEKEGFDYLTSGHFRENPASARVIAKLGFEPSGEVLRPCAARGNKSRCLTYRLTRDRALAAFAAV